MPRPKVKPENRQRSALACLPCKKLKIRCDAGSPCSTCVKRSRENECEYQASSERKPNHGRKRRATLDATKYPAADQRSSTRPLSLQSDDVASPEDAEPQSRTLLSSKFQKLYLGPTSSLSYLQFVREVVKHCIGPNAFSEGSFSSFMLESDLTNRNGTDDSSGSTVQRVEPTYVQSYLDATSGVLDLFSSSEIFETVDDKDGTMDVCCRYLILAIGAQCRGLPPSDLNYATAAFENGQKLAFTDFLRDPSQDMVRRFLLMSFYMTAACHRNAAFMYLGVAWKAASALGLHRADQYHRLSEEECLLRLKAWRSLRILDTIVNSILGRSGGPSACDIDPHLDLLWSSYADQGSNSRERAVQAAFDLCPFMDELERKGTALDPAFAKDFLKRLQGWSKALPSELRSATEILTTTNATCRESFVGAAHVACMYYFAVILASRRFFTMYILPFLKKSTYDPMDPASPALDSKTADLAHVCLDAARNLAEVGYNAIRSDRSVNNMPLMKAWLFAAGLLLGFWVFAHCDGPAADITEAFQQACSAMQKMAAFSPQAGHYYELLSSLGNVVNAHRNKKAEERKRLSSRYVDQVLTFDQEDLDQIDGGGGIGMDVQPSLLPSGTATGIISDTTETQTKGTHSPFPWAVSEGFPWPADDLDIDWDLFASMEGLG